jgi:hypothetical protein
MAAPAPDPDNSGLDALDRDRAASLADEGGAAGALVESQEGPEGEESQEGPGSLEKQKKKPVRPGNQRSLESHSQRGVNPIAAALTVAVGMLTGIVVWRLVRRER